jgi:hypothetical protein
MDVFVSDSDEIGNQKLSQLPKNTILKQERGATTSRLAGEIRDMDKYMAHKNDLKATARMLGSASDAQLGLNPVSGTPFSTTATIVQQGEGIHQYRRGKIATFFSDRLYPRWILPAMVKDLNKGEKWLDELTLEELQYVAEGVSNKEGNRKAVEMTLKYFDKQGQAPTQEEIDLFKEAVKSNYIKGGDKKFIEILKDELKDIPMDVMVNIAGKQAYLAQMADKISNVISRVMSNPQALQTPGMSDWINQLLEASGMNPINFDKTMKTINAQPQGQPQQQPQAVAQ